MMRRQSDSEQMLMRAYVRDPQVRKIKEAEFNSNFIKFTVFEGHQDGQNQNKIFLRTEKTEPQDIFNSPLQPTVCGRMGYELV